MFQKKKSSFRTIKEDPASSTSDQDKNHDHVC